LADFRFLAPFAVLVGLLLFAPVASASHVQCGDVITQNTKLDSDVICDLHGEEFSGLVIGADDVTLNLGGHALQNPDHGDGAAGISDDGTPRDRLRIVNGTVEGFYHSIDFDSSGSVVRGITDRSDFGVRLQGDYNTVRRNTIDTGYTGIGLSGDGNRAVHNDVLSFEGEGISATGRRILIANNTVRAKSGILAGIVVSGFADAVVTGNDVSEFPLGIRLASGKGASVTRNLVHDNYFGGIDIASDTSNVNLGRNTVEANGLEGEESGIRVDSPSVTVTRNTANDNGWYGIEAVTGVIDGGGNRASSNGNPAQCSGVECR
jgi:parallel beta-helix repeat protein